MEESEKKTLWNFIKVSMQGAFFGSVGGIVLGATWPLVVPAVILAAPFGIHHAMTTRKKT